MGTESIAYMLKTFIAGIVVVTPTVLLAQALAPSTSASEPDDGSRIGLPIFLGLLHGRSRP